mmetsp:Transcript_6479/g.19201  ORF Transcript_6479/g.19201 Transcript_6479/m.19201 type:complete len:235 (+) Transcript_6479:367-1071(+)
MAPESGWPGVKTMRHWEIHEPTHRPWGRSRWHESTTRSSTLPSPPAVLSPSKTETAAWPLQPACTPPASGKCPRRYASSAACSSHLKAVAAPASACPAVACVHSPDSWSTTNSVPLRGSTYFVVFTFRRPFLATSTTMPDPLAGEGNRTTRKCCSLCSAQRRPMRSSGTGARASCRHKPATLETCPGGLLATRPSRMDSHLLSNSPWAAIRATCARRRDAPPRMRAGRGRVLRT